MGTLLGLLGSALLGHPPVPWALCLSLHAAATPLQCFNPALSLVELPLCSLQSESCLEGGHRDPQEEISAAWECTSVSSSSREQDFLWPKQPVTSASSWLIWGETCQNSGSSEALEILPNSLEGIK